MKNVAQVESVIRARYDGDATLVATATRLLFGFPEADEFSKRPWIAVTIEGFEDVSAFGSQFKTDYSAVVKHASNSPQIDKVSNMSRRFHDRFHQTKLSGTGITAMWLLHVGSEGPLVVDGAAEIIDRYTVAVDWA